MCFSFIDTNAVIFLCIVAKDRLSIRYSTLLAKNALRVGNPSLKHFGFHFCGIAKKHQNKVSYIIFSLLTINNINCVNRLRIEKNAINTFISQIVNNVYNNSYTSRKSIHTKEINGFNCWIFFDAFF